ncbi:hypothetical protein EG68_02662 [Paragonimus skrjabini miyazakii]|uniref:Uncharacterized protein n=1 Tax=Paragonimus skrjabini miyazakii TaxID=59628 RepID=A0A8S9YXR1_9TREM|nr:hypothetical protein EG68_02662 [Paragonimus skrjabini miyazakii]
MLSTFSSLLHVCNQNCFCSKSVTISFPTTMVIFSFPFLAFLRDQLKRRSLDRRIEHNSNDLKEGVNCSTYFQLV